MANDDQIRVCLSCGQNYLLRWPSIFEFGNCGASGVAQALHALVEHSLDNKSLIIWDKRHSLKRKHAFGRIYYRNKTNRRSTRRGELFGLSQSLSAIRRSIESHGEILWYI